METIWAAVIGVGGTLVLAVVAVTWTLASRLARLQRAVESHSHVLENGLTAKRSRTTGWRSPASGSTSEGRMTG